MASTHQVIPSQSAGGNRLEDIDMMDFIVFEQPPDGAFQPIATTSMTHALDRCLEVVWTLDNPPPAIEHPAFTLEPPTPWVGVPAETLSIPSLESRDVQAFQHFQAKCVSA